MISIRFSFIVSVLTRTLGIAAEKVRQARVSSEILPRPASVQISLARYRTNKFVRLPGDEAPALAIYNSTSIKRHVLINSSDNQKSLRGNPD